MLARIPFLPRIRCNGRPINWLPVIAMQRHGDAINTLAETISACVLDTKARPSKEASTVLARSDLDAVDVCAGEEVLEAKLKQFLADRKAVHSSLDHAPAKSAHAIACSVAAAADHLPGEFYYKEPSIRPIQKRFKFAKLSRSEIPRNVAHEHSATSFAVCGLVAADTQSGGGCYAGGRLIRCAPAPRPF